MNDWYYLFLLVVFLIWLGATPADRNAVRVVIIASLASWLVVDYFTAFFNGAWKMVVPGAMETTTIICLLCFAPGRTGYAQAAFLGVAWVAHVMCFIDLILGTDTVYSRYEVILASVSLIQIMLFHDTAIHHFRRLGRWWNHAASSDLVRSASLPVNLLHNQSPTGLQKVPPCQKN